MRLATILRRSSLCLPQVRRARSTATQKRLQAGKERRASKALGYLAHIVGDVAQPMHTDSSDGETDSVHSRYEQAVDARAVPAMQADAAEMVAGLVFGTDG